jgi:hypothetical protein
MRVLWQQLDATARLQQGSSFSNLLTELLEDHPTTGKKKKRRTKRKPKKTKSGPSITTECSSTTVCTEATTIVPTVQPLLAADTDNAKAGSYRTLPKQPACHLALGPESGGAGLLMGSEARLLAAFGYADYDTEAEDGGSGLTIDAAEFSQLKVGRLVVVHCCGSDWGVFAGSATSQSNTPPSSI